MSGTNESFPRPIKTYFSNGDLERRAATVQVKRDPLTMAIHWHIVERDLQTVCINALCTEIVAGRRKMHVGMATSRGKAYEAIEHPVEEAAAA